MKAFAEIPEKLIRTYYSHSVFLIKIKDYAKALEFLQKIVEIELEHEKEVLLAQILDIIGKVYNDELKKHRTAVAYYDKSIKIRTNLTDPKPAEPGHENPVCYYDLDFDLPRPQRNLYHLAKTYFYRANALYDLQDFKQAASSYQQALDL